MSRRRPRTQPLELPKDAAYSASLVREMIRIDAAHGFKIPIPDGANFVEVSMPPAVLHARREARQAHPNASTLPPMVEVERGTMEHFIAVINGGVIFVKEDPQNPTVIDDDAPDYIKTMCQGQLDSKQS